MFRRKNEVLFEKWTSQMAYVLGYILADGSLIKNKRGAYFTEIQSIDKEIIVKIRKVFDSDLKISVYKPKKGRIRYRLQIGSKKIFTDLLKLGIKPKKSCHEKLPKIPSKYFSDFLRGYFDGDGSVNICTYQRKDRNKKSTVLSSGFTSGGKLILKQIWRNLKLKKIIAGGTLYFHERSYRLWFSIHDSLSLYNFLYQNVENGLFLTRKKRIFERYKN
ncbi:MAG: LAGLIDADG family homing endonuclease [Patescibacteria group bacterium]